MSESRKCNSLRIWNNPTSSFPSSHDSAHIRDRFLVHMNIIRSVWLLSLLCFYSVRRENEQIFDDELNVGNVSNVNSHLSRLMLAIFSRQNDMLWMQIFMRLDSRHTMQTRSWRLRVDTGSKTKVVSSSLIPSWMLSFSRSEGSDSKSETRIWFSSSSSLCASFVDQIRVKIPSLICFLLVRDSNLFGVDGDRALSGLFDLHMIPFHNNSKHTKRDEFSLFIRLIGNWKILTNEFCVYLTSVRVVREEEKLKLARVVDIFLNIVCWISMRSYVSDRL